GFDVGPTPSDTAHTPAEDRQVSLPSLEILHAVAQEMSLSARHRNSGLADLVRLIVQLSQRTQRPAYSEFWYMRMASVGLCQNDLPTGSSASIPSPPDALAIVEKMLAGEFGSVEAALKALLPNSVISIVQLETILPCFAKILKVAGALTNRSGHARSDTLLKLMVAENITVEDIEDFPLSLTTAFRQVLKLCGEHPSEGLSKDAKLLIGRKDLAHAQGVSTRMARRFSADELRTLPSGAKLDPLSATLFSADFRLQDVSDMLSTSRPTAIRAPTRPDNSDHENRELGLARLQNAAERIKATPVGRGMFLLLTRKFDPTQKWQTPRINLRILLRPAQPYGLSEPRAETPELEWPDFHNGCASALEMCVGKTKVDSTWYFSQSAGERTARHAGLLLGLGLSGRFVTIGQVHTYRYLGDRHSLTSIGLLLGLSATFVAKGDPDVRALLACHVKAFLPPHSANLAHSTLVQAAALLGTGLLFLGSGVSHIAEALCEQIGAQIIETTDTQRFCREAYCLSAALGVGLVMLGRGRHSNLTSNKDRTMLLSLERLMVGTPPPLHDDHAVNPTWRVDARITTTAAALAYGLIFLRSNKAATADKIPIPSCDAELNEVRPDGLLLLAIARSLINWDSMEPSLAWMRSTVPQFLLRPADKDSDTASRELAVMHLETGALFTLSLKFAGSANAAVKGLPKIS
ncbi:hypothetical protein, partial [Candidatus Phytoplasma melaleucae]